jgi:nucleotide-binding universal stress UspA family protein
MQSRNINRIFCAVRGVPQSRSTVTKAIDLALKYQARLTFIHINNADFLMAAGPTMTSLPKVIKQMRNLSEFTMVVLCDRAERRGVEEVDYILREGRILPQLYELLADKSPDLLVIGRPVEDRPEISMLKAADIDDFIQDVEDNLDIMVVPVELNID